MFKGEIDIIIAFINRNKDMPIINVLPKPQNLDIIFSCEDTQVKHIEEDILVLPETRPVPEASKINFQCIPELYIYMLVSPLYLDDSRIQIRCSFVLHVYKSATAISVLFEGQEFKFFVVE